MNCLIGKDFVADSCCCPAGPLTTMGSYGVLIITKMPATRWQNEVIEMQIML